MTDRKHPYCERHGVTYSALQPCAQCADDPAVFVEPLETFVLPTAPEGCVDSVSHERRLVEIAVLAETKARELLAGEARIGIATANQLALTAVKARIAASKLATDRESREYHKWLVAHEREMSARGMR